MTGADPGLWPDPPTSPPPAAAAEYLIAAPGLGSRDYHAVTRDDAAQALSDRALVPGRAAPVCGGPLARVLLQPVPFDRATAPLGARLCPTCSWHVAGAAANRTSTPDRDLLEAELAAWAPQASTAAALRRELGADTDLHARICRAIITGSLAGVTEDIDHPRIVGLLGTVTAHRPVLLVPDDCAEDPGYCRHRPAGLPVDDVWTCDFPDGAAACSACSVIAGPWAGEWEDDFDIGVPAPCSVLHAVAEHYDVPFAAQSPTPGKES